MSALLDIGKQCSTCDTFDFLPISCRYCSQPFCSAHIHTHVCAQASSRSFSVPGESVRRAQCQVATCQESTLESAGDVGGSEVATGLRCTGCAGAYCINHRSQDSHNCAAPRDRDKYHIALEERKAFAKRTLSKAFPELAGRVLPKPPPGRDVVREPRTTPPKAEATVAEPTANPSPPIPQTKAEKLRALSLRKMKSLARPLDPKAPLGDQVYFSWEIDESGMSIQFWLAQTAAEKEEVMGKRIAGNERATVVWVPRNMSAGRVLELLAKDSKINHNYNATDESKNLGLIALSNPSPTTAERLASPLILSKTLGEQVEDCSRLVIVRGPIT